MVARYYLFVKKYWTYRQSIFIILEKYAWSQTTNHISYYLWGYRKVSSLFKTTNSSFEILVRLISLPRSCYLRIVYNSLASLDFIGETNWCSHIRSLLFRTNHRDVWENHRVENANRLIKQVKSCLINTYKVDWSIKAQNSIKLQTHIKFKFEHSLEEYLFYIPDTRWMKALSRLGMSSHILEIERGRHVKPQKLPPEQRICQRCTSNSVDDEIHFLITCSELFYLPKADYSIVDLNYSQTTTNLYILCHLHIDH